MIDHMGFAVSDYERAKAFYARVLAPLDYELIMEVPAAVNPSGAPAAGFGENGKPDFWIGGEGKLAHPLHVAVVAKTRAAVDAFYKAAMRQAHGTTARRGYVRTITRTITVRSCSITTATTSRPSVTCLNNFI
jgi:catechol 2,3-dioxygenase-like lactoylglutathione lyase family enzyme